VLALVKIVLINVFSLFLGSVARKMRNSQELMRRKVVKLFSKERQNSNEV